MGAVTLTMKQSERGQHEQSLYSGWRGDPASKSRARSLRTNATDAEQLLWHSLRKRQLGGYRFRRQQPIGPYIVDFLCFEQRLVIELDGGHHAESHYDDERTSWLERKGFRVLRFWNSDVLGNMEGVSHAILEALSG